MLGDMFINLLFQGVPLLKVQREIHVYTESRHHANVDVQRDPFHCTSFVDTQRVLELNELVKFPDLIPSDDPQYSEKRTRLRIKNCGCMYYESNLSKVIINKTDYFLSH